YSPTSTYSPTVLPSAGSKRKRDALVDVPMDARNGAVATAAIVGGGGVHLSEHNPFYIAHGGPQKRQSKK
ncbi:1606_t:CDS:1, partial [Acaulospora colombiana]